MTNRRYIAKHIMLSEEEQKQLNRLREITGFQKESHLFRFFLKNCVPVEKPGPAFDEAVHELRKIGTNINQLAYVANATGQIDSKTLEQEKHKLDECVIALKRACLLPHEIKTLEELYHELEVIAFYDIESMKDKNRIMPVIKKLIDVKRRELRREKNGDN